MKRRLLLLPLFTLLSFGGFMMAQSYYFIGETGTSAPYFEDEPGTDLLTGQNNVLTPWQTMPFTWDFFGTQVTGYKASDNGYITFDFGASTSFGNNTTIPVTTGPNNAIYAFWDDLSGGTVRSWTIGVTPNQIHCVQWRDMTPSGGSGNITTTLRIYEGGDFDVVQDQGSGAVTTSSGTVGCENATGTLAKQLQSSPNTQFLNNNADNTDDQIFQFVYGNQLQWDLSVTSLYLSPTLEAGTHNVSGLIRNYGFTSVQSFKINYQLDNNPVETSSVNTLTLTANGGKYVFNHSIPLNLTTPGTFHTLKVWGDDLNNNNDEYNQNDTLILDLVVILGNTVPKKFLLEKFTGTWCGYCPNGDLYVDTTYANYPGQVVASSIHMGDAMDAGTTYPSFYRVSGVPSSMVDRSGANFNSDPKLYPTGLPGEVGSRLNQPSPVEILVFNTYDAGSRLVEGTAVMNFVDYAIGNLRFVLLVLEDGIVADQANFFGGQAGHPYENSPNPIPGFVHNHVLRATPLGDFGTGGLIPNLVSPSETYTQDFSYLVPSNIDINNVHLVGVLMNYSDDFRQQSVLNAQEASLDNGVAAPAPVESTRIVGISPNPADDLSVIRVDFDKPTEANFELYNAFGQRVRSISQQRFMPGTHHLYVETSSLAPGAYIVRAQTPQGVLSRRLVVVH